MIQDLINFYSQKYHVQVKLATYQVEIDRWNKQGILVGFPIQTVETRCAGKLHLGYDSSLGQNLEGDLIKVGRVPVAKVGGNFLVLMFNPMNKPAETYTRKLVDEHLLRIAKRFRQKQLMKFMQSMKSLADNICQEKKAAIQSDQWEVNRLYDQIVELNRKMELDRVLLNLFKRSQDKLQRMAIRIFVDLHKLVPGIYSSFKLEGGSIVGKTQPITIHYLDHEYRYEPYEVEVNIYDGKIQIRGESNTVSGYIHPHINGDSICWGNIGATVTNLAGRLELYGLFELIQQFLSTYNEYPPRALFINNYDQLTFNRLSRRVY